LHFIRGDEFVNVVGSESRHISLAGVTNVYDVEVVGEYLFIALGYGGVLVFDKELNVVESDFKFLKNPIKLVKRGNTLCILDDEIGIVTFDVSTKDFKQGTCRLSTHQSPKSIAISARRSRC
jgi:hypothetical protein